MATGIIHNKILYVCPAKPVVYQVGSHFVKMGYKVHYLVENKGEGIWEPMRTVRVICQITLEELDDAIKKKDVFVINALPATEFSKESIPGSVNLPVKTLSKKKEINL